MKILIFDTAASETGALKILKEFHEYVYENDTKNQWMFVVSVDGLKEKENIKILINKDSKKNWVHRIIFEIFDTNRIIKKEKPDVVLSLQNLAVLWTRKPQVIYFHQSLPYNDFVKYSVFKKTERFLAFYVLIMKILFKWSFNKSEKIIVQTQWLKDAIIKKNKINQEKIEVIPAACKFDTSHEKEKAIDIKGRFDFFYPANPFEHKNITNLVEAFIPLLKYHNNIRLYITINGEENSYSARIKEKISGYENRIILLGRISFSEVQEYYKKTALIFPSYVESFGLPLLEARSTGTDVLASKLPFAEEILKDYNKAWFFDPFNTDSISSTIKKYIDFKNSAEDCMVKHDESTYLERYLPANTWGRIIEILK